MLGDSVQANGVRKGVSTMLVSKVYIRFFRSFNYDYLRKTHPSATPHPWDLLSGDLFYPFVRVNLEPSITTIVGGNEAGKSQLLSAVRAALTGQEINRGDFCRYSQFFAVDKEMAKPDFGIELTQLTESEKSTLKEACELADVEEFESFALFRFAGKAPVAYVQLAAGWTMHPVIKPAALDEVLPKVFTIDATVPLPNSVPISFLASSGNARNPYGRRQRLTLLDVLLDHPQQLDTAQSLAAFAPEMHAAISAPTADADEMGAMLDLADDLLVKVSGIDRSAFSELYSAVYEGREGYANGIVERINKALSAALNFQKFWSQDHHFALLVTLRDFDLVFTIRDRTGTEYSFSERSGGLKYFLSYFVQYLAHEALAGDGREILLMDEPDAYLSSSGQQDLLRIFEELAHPSDGQKPCQVVYVTHSPFLIDKNHGERLRVLEKGEGEEGTRVVANAARNHYEPLRSAFGSFVAETTFISNCNLMLEGMSDQVLLAGMASHLTRLGVPAMENLDLNKVTLVPAGSAGHIPYMVYLARGRDVEKPAIVVLLDSDAAGDLAKNQLKKGGPKGNQLLDPRFVVQLANVDQSKVLSPNPAGTKTIEDLVPLRIALTAARLYAEEFLNKKDSEAVHKFSASSVDVGANGVHEALETAFRAIVGETFHLDKIALARYVLEVANTQQDDFPEEIAVLRANFRALFSLLGARQRTALRELTEEKVDKKINRLRKAFLADNPTNATKEQGLLLLEDIEASLVQGPEADRVTYDLRRIASNHSLAADLVADIDDFEQFEADLHSLAYTEIRAVQTAS
ncbi:hypothetical protein [Paenarthrobacter nicotinovorans]|nr:hypothetical protein [Paenarthrobacter nicotinovorans]